MARYIDAEKFKSHLEAAMEKMHLIGSFKAVDVGAVIKALDMQPTADVVPKSEVDRAYQRGFERGKRDNVCGFSAEEIAQKAENIAIDLEAMRTAANSYKMHYENARAEVVREIFEEIEKYLFYHENIPNTVYKTIDKNIFTRIKKKYTEGGEE